MGTISGTSNTALCLFIERGTLGCIMAARRKRKIRYDKSPFNYIKTRLDDQAADVHFFIIDNCCKWRNKIQEVFGENIIVLLDLFHAVQRITSTINKRHSLFNDCVKELKFVFRDRHDTGDKRTMKTPAK